jgi:hypothetical protein
LTAPIGEPGEGVGGVEEGTSKRGKRREETKRHENAK